MKRSSTLLAGLALLAGALAITLAACGGGSGGGSAPRVQADGVWIGTATEAGDSYGVIALVYDNAIYALSDYDALYRGNFSMSGSTLTGNLRAYDDDFGAFASSSLSASVVAKESIKGSFETTYLDGSGRTSGTMDLTYSALYERDSSLSRLGDIWTFSDGFGYDIAVTIQADGSFFGQDSDGCTFTGDATVPDPSVNVYRLTKVSMSSCGSANGTYSGYGLLTDYQTNGDNNALIAMLANNDHMLAAIFVRQM